MEARIHKWCAAQRTDVTARFIDGRWTIFDWTTHRCLARGSAIEVLRALRGLSGYAQPLERARMADPYTLRAETSLASLVKRGSHV